MEGGGCWSGEEGAGGVRTAGSFRSSEQPAKPWWRAAPPTCPPARGLTLGLHPPAADHAQVFAEVPGEETRGLLRIARVGGGGQPPMPSACHYCPRPGLMSPEVLPAPLRDGNPCTCAFLPTTPLEALTRRCLPSPAPPLPTSEAQGPLSQCSGQTSCLYQPQAGVQSRDSLPAGVPGPPQRRVFAPRLVPSQGPVSKMDKVSGHIFEVGLAADPTALGFKGQRETWVG